MLNAILLFIGTTEIIVIAAVVLLIFGGKKVPELMRGLGKGVKEFKDGLQDIKQETNTGDANPRQNSDSKLSEENKKDN